MLQEPLQQKALGPKRKGMAPKSTIVSYTWGIVTTLEALDEASTNGLLISNHSYGVPAVDARWGRIPTLIMVYRMAIRGKQMLWDEIHLQ